MKFIGYCHIEVQDEFTASIHYPYQKYYFSSYSRERFASCGHYPTAQLPVSKKQRTAHNSSGNSVSCGATYRDTL
jgi:hypothetical protein